MTLQEVIKAQNLPEKELEDSSQDAQFAIEKRQWLESYMTTLLIKELTSAIEELDAQAKDLAKLDEQRGASKIRALLIESKTLDNVLNYAKRTERNTSYLNP